MIIVTPSRLDDEGRIAIVTACGARDAMDARERSASFRADERCLADGEGVWSWHPWAGAKHAGDDPQATVTNKSRTPGRARISGNTIARGMPVDAAEPVVTAACFFRCRRAMGEAFTRHSPRPHVF